MELSEIEWLFVEVRDMTKKFSEHETAHNSLRRYIRGHIMLAWLQDFQMGLESFTKYVNMPPPNHHLSDINHVPTYTLLNKPEFRIVYENQLRKKRFLRFLEIENFCDGKLKDIF